MNNPYSNTPFRREVEELFRKLPVMEAAQFYRTLNLITGYKGDQLNNLVRNLIRNGLVLFTENDLVTTKFSMEVALSKDAPPLHKPTSENNTLVRLGRMEPKTFYRHCMDCYPLILDMYPASVNFLVTRSLYLMSFAHEEKGLIYEFIRVPRNQEDSCRAMMLDEALTYRDEKLSIVRDCIRRIAVVESPACAEVIPYTGIYLICVRDPSSAKGFHVVERRKEDVWKDVLEI